MEIAAAICIALAAAIIVANVWLMRNRKQAREAGLEAEKRNVTSNDTRRAFWSSGADHLDSGSGSSGGNGGSD